MAFVMDWSGVGFSKYAMLVLLAIAFLVALWRFGGAVFAGITKSFLWALAGICIFAGVFVLWDADGEPLPILGAFILWGFAAYSIKVAGAVRKRR